MVLDLTLPILGPLEVLVDLKLEASHSLTNGLLRLFPSCSSSFYLDRFGKSHALFCSILELITKTTEAHEKCILCAFPFLLPLDPLLSMLEY